MPCRVVHTYLRFKNSTKLIESHALLTKQKSTYNLMNNLKSEGNNALNYCPLIRAQDQQLCLKTRLMILTSW